MSFFSLALTLFKKAPPPPPPRGIFSSFLFFAKEKGELSDVVFFLGIALLASIALLVILDVLSRTMLKSKRTPPLIDASIPIVGGMLEFLKGPIVDGEGVSETRGGFYGAGVSRTNHVFDWPESV